MQHERDESQQTVPKHTSWCNGTRYRRKPNIYQKGTEIKPQVLEKWFKMLKVYARQITPRVLPYVAFTFDSPAFHIKRTSTAAICGHFKNHFLFFPTNEWKVTRQADKIAC